MNTNKIGTFLVGLAAVATYCLSAKILAHPMVLVPPPAGVLAANGFVVGAIAFFLAFALARFEDVSASYVWGAGASALAVFICLAVCCVNGPIDFGIALMICLATCLASSVCVLGGLPFQPSDSRIAAE